MAPKNEIQVDGRTIQCRGLSLREVRHMAELEMNPAMLTIAKSEEAMAHVLDLTIDKADQEFLQDQCYDRALKVYSRIMDLTYGRKVAEPEGKELV